MSAPLPLGHRGADARRRYLRRLRKQVMAGRYPVPAGKVADAIIEEHTWSGRR
jgi:anti-sigma28 factor (negative regulator of flagellin synthesis)